MRKAERMGGTAIQPFEPDPVRTGEGTGNSTERAMPVISPELTPAQRTFTIVLRRRRFHALIFLWPKNGPFLSAPL